MATYANDHAEPTVACAEAGVRAVLCEKPIAQSVPDAERMVAACADAGALLVINHQRRFNSSFRRARDHLASSGLGKLTSINAQWPTGRLGGVGSHVFDTIYHVAGRRVEAVSATLDLAGKPDARGPQFADPGGWGTMRFRGRADGDGRRDGTTVWRRGDVRVNGDEGRALVGSNDVRVEYWDGRTEHFTNDDQDGNGMDVAVREIVGWLDGESDFPYDPAETVQVLEAIAAFHASHRRNAAWVELPLTGRRPRDRGQQRLTARPVAAA